MVGGGRRAVTLLVLGLLSLAGLGLAGLGAAGPALAQQRQPRENPAPQSGNPTLQTEPGDFWADVRAWNEDARRRVERRSGAESRRSPDPGGAAPVPPRPPAEGRPRPRRPAIPPAIPPDGQPRRPPG
ncbi:MAG: hypothetical protein JWP04_3061 [Belnapia sp.]|nr:hypothetical protein [Belnapia sp.]